MKTLGARTKGHREAAADSESTLLKIARSMRGRWLVAAVEHRLHVLDAGEDDDQHGAGHPDHEHDLQDTDQYRDEGSHRNAILTKIPLLHSRFAPHPAIR